MFVYVIVKGELYNTWCNSEAPGFWENVVGNEKVALDSARPEFNPHCKGAITEGGM